VVATLGATKQFKKLSYKYSLEYASKRSSRRTS